MPRLVSKSMQQLLGISQFRLLFMGNTAMMFGFFGTILLRSLLAWNLTEDEMALAYINLLAAICMFASSLFAGTLIDRFERRRMLLIAQTSVFTAELFIMALLITEQLTFPLLLVSSIVASIAWPFIMPARTAMMVSAVGKARVPKATAVLTTGVNLARMVSPAVIGIFADSMGYPFCYTLLLSLHAISLACTLRLNKYPAVEVVREHFIKETFKGFSYLRQHKSLGLCILFGILPLMIVQPLQNLMVVFVEELWHEGGSGLGIMMAAMGVGGILGSISMTLLREESFVKPMIASAVVMSLFLFLFANSPNFWMAIVMVLGIYGASVLSHTLVSSAVQLMAEDYIRGRVTTISMMSLSLAPIGTIPLAFATKHLGAAWSLTIAAGLLLIAVFLLWAIFPSFRKIDEVTKGYSE